jgi:calcium/calmodulin-dependent protein kinase (CaM kinase) II/calcium/calmodulin-dependent protein kinase I
VRKARLKTQNKRLLLTGIMIFLNNLTGKRGGKNKGVPDRGSRKSFQDSYFLGKKLGEGVSCEVREVTSRQNRAESYAVKIFTKSKLTREDTVSLQDEI